MAKLDLRQRFDALRRAVVAEDPAATTAALQAIDADLEGADPLTRGAAYAEVQRLRGRPLDAAAVLDDLLAVLGDDARVHLQVAVYREQGEDFEGALRSYARANAADPSLTEAWVGRGVLLDRRGEWTEALQCYRSAMLVDPQSVETWRNMGNCLAAQRKFDEAAGAYDTALGLAVGDQTIAFLRASAYAAKGDLDTAHRLMTPQMRRELGVPMEERRGDAVCRFFAPLDHESQRRAGARRLLSCIDVGLPRGVFAVDIDGLRHVCDPDPVRPQVPHRFLDASVAVVGE